MSRLADELARSKDSFEPTATLVGDLGLDELELLLVMMFVVEMTPTSAMGQLDWDRATLGDVYGLYVGEAVENALAQENRS